MIPPRFEPRRRGRRALHGLGIGFAAGAVALVLSATGALDRIEYAAWSWRVQLLAEPSEASKKIKLILIDQESLGWAKRTNSLSWPWPREAYKPILDFCARAGARSIAIDMIFTEPSVYGVSDDEVFAEAIAGNPRIVGPVFLAGSSGEQTSWPEIAPEPPPIEGFEHARTLPFADFPIPELLGRFRHLGNVSAETDPDGVLRRIAVIRCFDGRAIPALGIASAAAADTSARVRESIRLRPDRVTIDGRTVRLDPSGQAILRFRGPKGSYEAFSAAAVIQSELRIAEGGEPSPLDPAVLRDCFVFLGTSAAGLLDRHPTPVDPVFPGVAIHATALDNLISGDFLHDAPAPLWGAALFALAILTAGAVVLLRRTTATILSLLLLLAAPMFLGVATYSAGWWWPVAVAELGVILAGAAALLYNYETEGRTRRQIRHAFEHYLSPVLVRDLEERPELLRLSGEKRLLTIFFSDIEGFSTFSERLDPEELTALLMDYLGEMTEIIYQERGTLDKYEGDAIVAFWNAPLEMENHPLAACRAAIRCQRRIQERAESDTARLGQPLRVRIGIHTGPVVVGNLGSRHRFNYTVLGDAANLASRLEGANKHFGTRTIVSESCWNEAGDNLLGREIGIIRVVGRETPVRVFETLGEAGATPPAWLHAYEEGLRLCNERRWGEALAAFALVEGEDPLSALYARRCREILAAGGEGWDLVWNLKEK